MDSHTVHLDTVQVEARAQRLLELDQALGLIDQSRVLHAALVLLVVDAPTPLRRDVCSCLIRSFQRLAE